MLPSFAIAGKLTREYLLPPNGNPRLDRPGGNLLYAASGLAVWNHSVALLARINKHYPLEWIQEFADLGFDVQGIQPDPESNQTDVRSFLAYTETLERSHANAVSHFARRGLSFPKSLLGYQAPENMIRDLRSVDLLSPTVTSVPKSHREIRHVHICPFDFTSQSLMVNLFKGGASQVISLDPYAGYMKPAFWREIRLVLQGVKIFLPSEEEMRNLFWGETHDLWEMAARISDYGPEIIVIKRGPLGQYVYDALHKRRYEVPAYPSRLVDPTGAGDAFCGGFLAGYKKTQDILAATLYGNISASLKIEGSGPFSILDVMPGLAEARFYALQEMAREV